MDTLNGEKSSKRIYVISGPESTGKSTLASQLADHFKAELIPEYARSFLKESNGVYSESDLAIIAKTQQQMIDEAKSEFLICDTDLLTILIWQATKYGHESQDLHRTWQAFQPSMYLVCKPDIPWIYDPLRECETIREDLFDIHLELLKKEKKTFEIVDGGYEKRFQKAKRIIERDIGLNL